MRQLKQVFSNFLVEFDRMSFLIFSDECYDPSVDRILKKKTVLGTFSLTYYSGASRIFTGGAPTLGAGGAGIKIVFFPVKTA